MWATTTTLFQETWGSYTGAVSSYTFTGTTASGGTTGLSYSVDHNSDVVESNTAGSITTNNLFFYKKAASSLTISGIDLQGAKNLTLSFKTNGTNFAVYYKIGTGAEQQVCSNCSTGANSKTITLTASGTMTLRFNKTGTSNNNRLDDIVLTTEDNISGGGSGNTTVSIDPADGTIFYEETKTITLSGTDGADFYYTLDGNDPNNSSTKYNEPFTISETKTIKAIAIKDAKSSDVVSATITKGEPITSYTINFEAGVLTPYINWEFENIGIHSSGITAQGGSKWGSNVNSSDNATASAKITTKNKVSPQSISFYTSKETGNNTSSNWKVNVSEDGSSWTQVGSSMDATTGSAGTWQERSIDLSNYKKSNVYVQIEYAGSNAKRAIDDIVLELYEPISSAVAITNPEHGTVVVKKGDDNVASANEVTEGTVLTASIADVTGYRFTLRAYKTGDANTIVNIDKDGKLTMPAYPITITADELALINVAVAVNDNEMGSATINGGTATVYAEYADDVTLVATANPGYEFVNWTANTEDIEFDDATKANGAIATIGAAGTITANFQAQACTGLNAPTLGEITKTYNSATIAWVALANASQGYEVHVYSDNEKTNEVASDLVTSGTSFNVADLDANTTYYFTIMGIGDGTSYCDENNTLREGNFTTSDYPSVAVTYSENNNSVSGGSKKIMTPFALPDEVTNEISGKTFVGWTTKSDFEDGDESDEETYFAKGANFTIQSNAAVTLYAVYATAGSGDVTISSTPLTSAPEQGAQYVIGANHKTAGIKYFSTYSGTGSDLKWGTMNASTTIYFTLSGTTSALTAYDGSAYLKNRSGGFEMSTTSTMIALQADGAIRGSSEETATRLRYNSDQDSFGLRWYASDKSTGNPAYFYKVEQNVSYSDYVISGSAALPVLDAPTGLTAGTYYEAQTITLAATNDAAIYYSLDGNDPTVDAQHLYSEPFTLSARGTTTIKAIAVKDGYETSEVATATYTINIPFATIGDLFSYLEENSLTELNDVIVTGVVTKIVTEYSSQHKNVSINIADDFDSNSPQLEGYRTKDATGVTAASVVAVGDKVTLKGNYTYFQSTTHELAADNTIEEYTAKVLSSVTVGGTASKTAYSEEDNQFSFAGLTATANYNNTGYSKDVTNEVTWKAAGETTYEVTAAGDVNVTATLGNVTSDPKVVAVTFTAKTVASIRLEYASTYTFVGFDLPKPKVYASYVEDIPEEEVTELLTDANYDTKSVYDKDVADNYTITVEYKSKETTYSVTVKAIYNTQETAHSVADAIEIIKKSTYTSTSADPTAMYVHGFVCTTGTPNNNGQLTYYINDTEEEEGRLQVYQGKYFENASFDSNNNLAKGDEVIIEGHMLYYKSATPELKASPLVYLLKKALPTISVEDVAELEVGQADLDVTELITKQGNGVVSLESGDLEKLTVDGLTLHAVGAGDVTVTANLEATANNGSVNYKANSTTFTVHVIAARTRYTVTFAANGGTGTNPTIANQLENATVTLPETNPYTKEGNKFMGWLVSYDETVLEKALGESFTMPAADVTIKPKWEEVATCAISFEVNGEEVFSANAPQTDEYSLASATYPTVNGFAFLGWSETEVSDEVEEMPTIITSYTPEAGESSLTLYGIYKRVEGAGETNHYVLDYTTDVASLTLGYGSAKDVTATDGSAWVVKADKNNGMQINKGKNSSIKIPTCPNNIVSIAITGGAAKKVGFSESDYSGSGDITYVVQGTDATSQNLSFAGKTVTAGYIVPVQNANQITHIDVEYDASRTLYTSSPVEKVTITFNANGGEGGCQNAIINKGSQLTICAEAPTKLHSEFAGWKNGDDVYEAGQAYTFDADITLTAQWNYAATYDVTYNANGATGTVPTEDDQYAGDAFEIANEGALVKSGYDFQGWKYDGKLYAAGASFTMPASAVEFVAQWKKENISSEKLTMITSASALANGMQIALGYSADQTFAMAGEFASGKNFMSSVSGEYITLNNGVASYTEDVLVMTLEQVENGWKITKDGTNYLTSYGNSNDDLKWDTKVNATVWTISFNGNNVKIENTNNKWIQYNSSNPRFKTYGAGSNMQAILLFGKAVEVTATAKISDLGYVEGENIIASGANVTLTIDAETNAKSITAQNGATIVVDQPTTAENVVVEEGSKIVTNAPTTTPTVYFATKMGAADNNGNFHSTASELGEVTNITLATGGEIIYDLTLGTSKAGVQADPNQWHAFSLPFEVDAISGIFSAETGEKLTNEVNYAIMDYHGDIRANDQYGWKKYRGTLKPGVFYLMTVDGETKTFRFKATQAGKMTQTNSMKAEAYDGTSENDNDKGWNGFGNPRWIEGRFAYNAQYLDPYTYEYITITPSMTIPVGLPFFYKASETSYVSMGEVGGSAAPARVQANEIKDVAVSFGNEESKDKLYISASEDALNEYEQDKDLVKMFMSQTPKVARISGKAYGMKLCVVNAPMVNDKAEFDLTLYVPQTGEYTISVSEVENADIYLTHEGTIIWNLSMSACEVELTKGTTENYGLLLVRKTPGVATGMENVQSDNVQCTKVIIDNQVFILRGGQMYDLTGKKIEK